MIDVFISYARPDEQLATALQERLEEAEWSVWRDARLESGEDYREQIEEALEASRVTIVLWSEASRKSRWVRSEAERAASHDKLMAARLEDVAPPLGLDQYQATSLVAWRAGEPHPGVDTLLDQLSERLGRTAKVVEDQDAQMMRRLRRRLREAKTSTLLALAAAPLGLLLHGSGILDNQLQVNARLRLLSVQARYLMVDRALDERLAVVVADDKTAQAIQAEKREGQPIGQFSANWRVMHAELLTRLAAAGAKVVAFDIAFPRPRVSTPLAEHGTERLAAAIVAAKASGTSVAIVAMTRTGDGALDVDPRIQAALDKPVGLGKAGASPPKAQPAQGTVTSPCVGFQEGGATLGPVLITNPNGPQPGFPSLALASVQGLWGLKLGVMPADQQMILSGPSAQRHVQVSGFGREIDGPADCLVLQQGDRPVHQILDLYPDELTRSHERVLPFETVLRAETLPQVRDKLVIVGTQLTIAGTQDRHWVFQCGTTPWSCGPERRWGMNLQVDMANNLLRDTAIRTLGPVQQLLMMLAFCFAAAWLRLAKADRPPRTRRAWLLLLVGIDMGIAAVAGVAFQLLMDAAYHVLAMGATYAAVSRLDRKA